jgi:hypothetical protein
MNLHAVALVIHVLVAILGVGSVAAIALFASVLRRSGRSSTPDAAAWLTPLLRYSAVSLAVMLGTGALLDLTAGGAFHETWWFRASGLLLFATGFLQALARRALRRGLAGGAAPHAVLGRVERIAYGMCLLVGLIVVLMQVKPY